MERKAGRYADEPFVRLLWNERFSKLLLPEDFIRKWTAHKSMFVIGAFKDAEMFYKRFPEKSAMDIARVISSIITRSHIAREKNPYQDHVLNACEFQSLWHQFFPNYQLPPDALKYWVDSRRNMSEALPAFKTVKRIVDEDRSKSAEDVMRLISSQMRRVAMARPFKTHIA